MPWRYSVFGLSVETDRPIRGFAASESRDPPDLEIVTSGWPPSRPDQRLEHYVSPELGLNGRPLLKVWSLSPDQVYHFLYDDDAEFLIDARGTEVWARWPETLTIDDVGPYIAGPILGFVLLLRGVTSLHASAVVVDDQAVAFLGPPGAGKSTTAAAFARLGFPVLSDDIVALEDHEESFLVNSGYPWLRLWPSSVESLFGSREALPAISPDDPTWNKRFLDLSDGDFRFAPKPLPLGALYILAGRTEDEAAPRIVESSVAGRFLGLARNTYLNYMLDKEIRAREFEVLARVARSVPVRVVEPHIDRDRIDRLCEVILSDFTEVRKRSPMGR